MATHELNRRQKAAVLVPIALLCGGWTVSMAGFGSADAAGKARHDGTLPDGTTVPSKAIQAPANLPVSGQIAPGVPDGDADAVANGASTSGIPSAALSAYQRAAQIIDAADTSCHVPWELIAAIGRVESDHGRYGGNVLESNGVSKPGVLGPVLDGQDGTQAIKDTDGGELDQDTTWDRAVGPMQFIPSTWQVVKVDADGDGQRNPQDIDDASLATGVYLCSGTEDLAKTTGQKAAVYRYNHSDAYVDLVLRIMEAYQAGDYTAVPNGISGGQTFSYPESGSGGGQATPKAKLAKPKPSKASVHVAAPSAAPTGSSGNQNGSSGNNSHSGSGSGSSSTPKAPVSSPPVHVSTPDPAPVVTPVVKTLNQLGQTAAFCSSALGQYKDLPGAMSACTNKFGGMTQSAASNLASSLSPKSLLALLGISIPGL
ncbi:lytic transglycosylase domain-containing protein [Nocardioides mangrovicus]|nr:lytic murein transglycosylase [Nocardioides mangrovicus]